MTGVIPAIALAAGLLSVPPESALRAAYWPWLPLVALGAGLLFSAVFWLVIVPRRDHDKDE